MRIDSLMDGEDILATSMMPWRKLKSQCEYHKRGGSMTSLPGLAIAKVRRFALVRPDLARRMAGTSLLLESRTSVLTAQGRMYGRKRNLQLERTR
jgi:hypothetical protein